MWTNHWMSRDMVELRNDSIGQSSHQDEKSKRIGIIFLFATTCIMLCFKNDIKDLNQNINQWDLRLINFYTLSSLTMYLLICAFLCNVQMCNPKLMVICLIFVSISCALFAYLRSVNPGIHILTIFWQTLLIMDAIALFSFVLATFIKPRGGGIGEAGEASTPPDFGRIEGGVGQHECAALLLNHSDFQTMHHPCPTVNPSSMYS